MRAAGQMRGGGWGNAWPTAVAEGRLPGPIPILGQRSAGSQSFVGQNFGLVAQVAAAWPRHRLRCRHLAGLRPSAGLVCRAID